VPPWPLGGVRVLPEAPGILARAVADWLAETGAEFGLFWDSALGTPSPQLVEQTLGLPGDVWHAGLALGTVGLPEVVDFVEPLWMLNHDPDPSVVATSWRISLRACLVRAEVLRQLGGPDPAFDTLTGAALELGARLIGRGAIVRHVPDLLPGPPPASTIVAPSVHDELRFVRQKFSERWLWWAAWRAAAHGRPLGSLLRALVRLRREGVRPPTPPYDRGPRPDDDFDPEAWHGRVSVMVPTLQRYPYLCNELRQLRGQTVRPREIVVVDQTPRAERETAWADEFADLPLRLSHQDVMGQCTAWNEAISRSTGEYLLFLGDDADRIAPDFVEKFLRTAHALRADMVACAVEEVGSDPVPEESDFLRVADTFPIALARRDLFARSGLYDLAFDRGARADADVALRWLDAGALMIFDPRIRVLHLKAPRGGLRAHKARVITRASSRRNLWHRDLPSRTEIYLMLRHHTSRQLREMVLMRIVGTLIVRGGRLAKVQKCLVSLFCLPDTLRTIRTNRRQAREMLGAYPQIPALADPPRGTSGGPGGRRDAGPLLDGGGPSPDRPHPLNAR